MIKKFSKAKHRAGVIVIGGTLGIILLVVIVVVALRFLGIF